MTRKLFLPLASLADARPTVDAVRKRLGGRASTEHGAGQVVRVPGGATGVVLFVHGDDLDVWFTGDVVRRVQRADVGAVDGVVPADVVAVAKDARAFGGLAEGQGVAFQQDGGLRQGVLVEKCRFGALVQLATGVVAGVAFRRVVALPSPAPQPG